MSASEKGLPYGHAAGRVAKGFGWADNMDAFYADGGLMSKAFTSTDQGRTGYTYGEVLWQQANTKTPLWGMMPKVAAESRPSNLESPQPLTYRVAFNPPAHTGVAEGGTWDTEVEFDTREVQVSPNTDTIKFEGTIIQDLLGQIQDGVPLDNLVQIGEEYFQRSLEANGIGRNVQASSDGAYIGDYSADLSIAPLDRVVASSDEEANATGANGAAYGGGELDIYDIDRSDTGAGGDNEANWADAVVDHNAGNGDRQLTKDLVNGVIQSLEENGARREDLVIFTGHDTARVLSDLRDAQFRGDALAAAGRESPGRGEDTADTAYGVNFNSRLSHWDGVPVVEGQHVASDSLSRMYFLDMSTMQDPVTGANIPKIGIETYIPMFVETAGLGEQTNTLAINSLSNQVGVGVTHELRCNRFNHQGKLRDLSE